MTVSVDLGPTPGPDVPPAAPAGRSAASRWRSAGPWSTATALVLCGVAAWRLREILVDGVAAVGRLEPVALGGLLAAFAATLVCRAAVHRCSHRGTTLVQGFALDQVNVASTNAFPGGMVVGGAARFRMGCSFGQRSEDATVSLLASGQAISLGRWLLLAVVTGRAVATGRAEPLDAGLLVVSVVVAGATVLLWALGTGDSRIVGRGVELVETLVARVTRRLRRGPAPRIAPFAHGVRAGGRGLLRERGLALLAWGAVAGLAAASISVVAVQGVDGPAAPGAWDLLRAYLLARVATSFVPTPGNVGALDGALAAAFVAAGASPSGATAGVLVYRSLTFVVPVVLGAVAWVVWRRWERSTGAPGLPEVAPWPPATTGAAPPGGPPCSTSVTPTTASAS